MKLTLFLKKIKISHCDIEIKVKWTKIHKLEKDEIAPLIIASFDIETFSHDGKFLKHIDLKIK